MKRLLAVFGILVFAGVIVAQDKPVEVSIESLGRVPCNLIYVAHDWDFAVSDQGFTTTICDPTGGGTGVWGYGAYGTEVTSDPPTGPQNVWGVALGGNYPNNSGEGLVSPAFDVTPATDTMEILHYVHTETNYDGCNVSVGGTVVPPTDGYPATISTSASYYAYCVDLEEGFTGNGFSGVSEAWVERCFDLSAYDGQNIQVEFDFGSDSSVGYPGWYLAYVKIGDPVIPVELQSFDVE